MARTVNHVYTTNSPNNPEISHHGCFAGPAVLATHLNSEPVLLMLLVQLEPPLYTPKSPLLSPLGCFFGSTISGALVMLVQLPPY